MPTNLSKLSCRFAFLTFCALGLTRLAANAEVYQTIETSFSITNLSTDPFDYTITDVRVEVAQPDSTTVWLPAFFDGGTTWRVRHTPTMIGLYQVNSITLNGQPLAVSNLQPASWTVTGPVVSPGFVQVDPANASRFITSNGRRYFPVGHNVAWDTSATTNVVSTLARLGAARENWSRIWMDNWDGKNLDWPRPGAFGQLSLSVAQKWDGIVAAAEQSGVCFQMTLQHHGQYSSSVDPQWSSNPYNTVNGGFLSNATQFFTNATAKALTKRKLRYAVARWGYSPAIMAWELFNEVQFTDAAQAGQWSIIGAWHDEMAQFIRSQDSYHHLITTSSDLNQPIWNQCDYYTHHDYPADLISTLSDPAGVPSGQPLKPIFGAECGLDNTPHLGVNAPIWAGLMGAQAGNSQPWWWDRIDADNDYASFHAVSDFTLYSGLAEQDTLNRSSPHVTSSQNSALIFSPGGGWGNAVQDTFTVQDAAPSGIGTLPSYLQGTYHRSMTPNGYTFLVNYPPGGGTFSVQILIVASSGAGLTISLDGTTANSISFPSTTSDQNTNYTLSVNVPAGQHTLNLWNPGLDWLNLGNITLNPYVSIVGAYQIGNTNFAALWFWHRTNVYNPNATATIAGTFPLAGLAPGTYSGTWWDTFAGRAISNFPFTVSGSLDSPSISTPPILRSMAFFAAKPPAVGSIAGAEFPLVLGTNSPPLTLNLQIPNTGPAGGLPLLYSLSITGATPLSYSALTSLQPGGPVFAWNDYSAIGQDITTNFTALAGKTAKDEGIAGPINVGFAFPFFSGGQSLGLFTQLYVSPNGFVSFSPFSGDTSTNQPLPSLSAPTNLIAFFWDDLDLSTTGHVYTYSDALAGTFTIQFQDARFKGTSSTVTCQLILKTTGEILMQYKTMAVSNSCTVGVQNASGNQGLQIAFNQNYLQTNLCILLTPTPWLVLDANAGLVPGAKTNLIGLTLNVAGLGYGTNRATILIRTGDPLNPLAVLPVELDVTPLGTWRQTYFGTAENSGSAADNADPDGDGLVNLLEYAFNTNPKAPNGSPLSYAITGGHLTVTLKRAHPAPTDISYLFEVADDLISGVWNSGPDYTTQTVTDNLDGSETVIVTDLVAVPSRAAHYLRVRVSAP